MRIILLTTDHAYASYVVRDMLSEYGNDVVHIYYSNTLLPKKTFTQALLRYYRISGIKYIVWQGVKLEIYKIFGRVFPKLSSAKKLASTLGVTYSQVSDINNPQTVSMIKKLKPDLIVSVFFNQILKSEVINIPSMGVINLHPAYLPNYKGVSPVFWAIANREKTAGVSVHYINAGIDTGGIIARELITVEKSDTEDSLYWKCVRAGCSLLKESIREIKIGSVKTVKNAKGSYYSLPTKAAVKKYAKGGRPFFRLKEYLFEEGYHFWVSYPKMYNAIQFLATGGFMPRIARELSFLEGKSVLDLGCGTGNLIRHFRFKKYTGLDINPEYVHLAKQAFPSHEFKTANIVTDTLPQDRFDHAITVNILHHLTDDQVALFFKKVKKLQVKSLIIVESAPKGVLGNTLERLDAGGHFRDFTKLKRIVMGQMKIERETIVTAPLGTYHYLVLHCTFGKGKQQ